MRHDDGSSRDGPSASASTSTGITLLSVLLGVACTVALGIEGEWWVRVLTGAGVLVLLLIGVRVGSEPGHGPLARLASWVMRQGR